MYPLKYAHEGLSNKYFWIYPIKGQVLLFSEEFVWFNYALILEDRYM